MTTTKAAAPQPVAARRPVKRLRRLPLSVALVIAAVGILTVTGLVLDLVDGEVSAWFGVHQFVTATIGNSIALLLALVGFVLVALAVALLERQGDESRPWKVILGGICGAALVGGSAAEFTTSFGEWAEKHPVFTGALTGAALAIITVLVIESLLKMLATNAWEGSLRGTWISVVKGGRRGAHDLREQLLGGGSRVTAAHLPKPDDPEAEKAFEVAHKLWISLEGRVTNASLAAFASDHPELGESMHKLSTAADTLQRAFERYSSRTPSHTGELRTPYDIVQMWRDYVWCLLEVEDKGRSLEFPSPMGEESLGLFTNESRDHEPSTWLTALKTPAQQSTLGRENKRRGSRTSISNHAR